jgi:energy-coupling factor transporter ATP-binding protein EcfA2
VILVESLSATGDLPSARGAATLRDVSFQAAGGVYAMLGAPHDGASLLLAVLAGVARPRTGRATTSGETFLVPLEIVLPEALRVDEICELATDLRGEPARSSTDTLRRLGLEHLAKRGAASLSVAEARAVALAIGLASSARVLLVEEPLSRIDAVASSHAVSAIREFADGGRTVLATTSSVRDASGLGDVLGVLTRGVYVALSPALVHAGPRGAVVRVLLRGAEGARDGAARLVSALVPTAGVVTVDAGAGASEDAVTVVVRGPDILSVAAAVTTAAARERIEVLALEPEVAGIDGIRGALAALAVGQGPSPPVGAT